jgi:hypothetical protein
MDEKEEKKRVEYKEEVMRVCAGICIKRKKKKKRREKKGKKKK